jgi:uncharacterized repeat protein (TIGR03843 family)
MYPMNTAKVVGQMANASNSTLVVEVGSERFIYKPRSGERPLWDFPDHTLYKRERAAYVTSELLGWEIVPETTIQEGPYGVGSFQQWIDAEPTTVDIFPPNTVPEGWLTIVTGIDEEGNEVTLAHEDTARLQQIALFDALINNADRKAGHLLTDSLGKTFGIDHGVTFNSEDKLRTVLWGWIGNRVSDQHLSDLGALSSKIPGSELEELLDASETDALVERLEMLLTQKVMPSPSPHWPAVPWPVF